MTKKIEITHPCYGSRVYTVSHYENGVYYFLDRTLAEEPLRYNQCEGRVEYYDKDQKRWDVYADYITQVDYIEGD